VVDPLDNEDFHLAKDKRFRTISLNHACGFSGPPSHNFFHSDGTLPERREVAVN
jgi:hypothetical protein